MGKQMTAVRAGAPIDDAKKWSSINWKEAQRQVRRLQMRIAKAVKEHRWNKVKALQHLLTHSFNAKLLAVKRVTSNKGKNTPGIDGVLWKGVRAKRRAACSLCRRGYRRIYVPRANLSKAWQEIAHHTIKRGSPRPRPKVGNANQKTRQRSDTDLD
jgi:RNA-directed DNA polymerase